MLLTSPQVPLLELEFWEKGLEVWVVLLALSLPLFMFHQLSGQSFSIDVLHCIMHEAASLVVVGVGVSSVIS
jgi:hypothetical protein